MQGRVVRTSIQARIQLTVVARAIAASFVAWCAVSLFLATAPASADNGPHVMGVDGVVVGNCAGCHRIQVSNAGVGLTPPQPGLCYTCHGGDWAGANTDVVNGVGFRGANRTGPAEALRGGGFEYALIDSANPSGQSSSPPNADGTVPVKSHGAAVTSTHSVNSSSQMAWGNGTTSATAAFGENVQLQCSTCHDPHGNGNYRILRPVPKGSRTTQGIAIPDAATKIYTTNNYWQVEDKNAPGFIANISAWCSTCHSRFLGDGASTDSGDAGYTHRHRTNMTSQGSALCVQCHIAHGSNASMGANSGGVDDPAYYPDAGSRLLRIDNRGVCRMCHSR